MIFIATSMFTLEELFFVENVKALTVHHKSMTDVNSIGNIGKGLSLVQAIILQQGWIDGIRCVLARTGSSFGQK